MAAELETSWNLDTKSRRDKCNSEVTGWQHWEIEPAGVYKSSQHDLISYLLCFEQTHRGDHFILEHPSNASSWNELCVQKPIAQASEFGVNVFEEWWKRGNSLSKRESKADSIGDAVPTVANVDKTQNGCELEEKKISEGLAGSVHETESKVESTSKRVVVAEAKEKEKFLSLAILETRSTRARTT